MMTLTPKSALYLAIILFFVLFVPIALPDEQPGLGIVITVTLILAACLALGLGRGPGR